MMNTPRRRSVMAEELAKIEQEIRMLQQARSLRLPDGEAVLTIGPGRGSSGSWAEPVIQQQPLTWR